jgi:soluble lytic murein transglycosylase-like protein
VKAKDFLITTRKVFMLNGTYQRFKQFIKRASGKPARKIAASLMTFALVVSISPLGGFKPTETYQTSIVFNEAAKPLLALNGNKVVIEAGKSSYDNATIISTPVVKSFSQTQEHNDPKEFRPIYMAAAKQFNVPWQLIEAVHEVESGKSGSTAKRSYAGATGPMQFMPGTFRAYAVDGNNDGKTDITDVSDSIYTAARYLANSGADEGRYNDALFNYNHSQSYVNTVKGIAEEIGLPQN